MLLEADKSWSQVDLENQALGLVERENRQQKLQGAIVELRLQGQVGFDRLDLNFRDLHDRLKTLSQALIFLLKSELAGSAYLEPLNPDQHLNREAIELSVFKDFLAGHHIYQHHLEHFAQGLSHLKQKLLEGEAPDPLYRYATDLRLTDLRQSQP